MLRVRPAPALVVLLSALLEAAAGAIEPAQQRCNDQWPQWSPDGRSIVFTSDRTGDPEIYVRPVGPGEPVRLTRTPGRDAHPAFSPDGRFIAFQSPRDGGHTNLYMMRSDGSDQRRLTAHEGFAGVPVWSPDGSTLAYQWTPRLDLDKWRIMLHDLASGASRGITDGSANDQVPNWSPDGRRLVFHSDRTGRNQLYLRDMRSGEVTRLADSAFSDQNGAWSPDGSRLAFMSTRAGSPAAIFVTRVDFSDVRRLGSIAPDHGVPFFSPDGGRVLATPVIDGGRQVWAVDVADGRYEVLSSCRVP